MRLLIIFAILMIAVPAQIETLLDAQLDKFKEAAREPECEDDERRFDERMKKIVEKKPEWRRPI